MILYHNTRCRKSREALNMLEENGRSPEIREYLKETLTAQEIKDLLVLLNIKAENLIRKNEKEFIENFKGKEMTESMWIKAMVKYPKLIQRPILINNDQAVIGRPPELILDII